MSSERVDGLNRDWPGRANVFRSYGGELDQDMVDQLDRAHTTPERTEQAVERLRSWAVAGGMKVQLANEDVRAIYDAIHEGDE